MTKPGPGSNAAWRLSQHIFGVVHQGSLKADLSCIAGVARVRTSSRSRLSHAVSVEMEDGTTRNFTIQVIEHH